MGNCEELISRQAAFSHFRRIIGSCSLDGDYNKGFVDGIEFCSNFLGVLPSEQPEQRWIPVTERLPEELAEVNVTWENTNPEPYYDFVKGHRFTGTAVYFRGRWYWYSAVCVDYLKEYGFSPNDDMDDAIKVLAWMPLPEPYQDGERDG